MIDEVLTNIKIIGQESYQSKRGGEYVHYVAMEMSTSEVGKRVIDEIDADQELKQDFDLEKFRKIYEEELENFKNGN